MQAPLAFPAGWLIMATCAGYPRVVHANANTHPALHASLFMPSAFGPCVGGRSCLQDPDCLQSWGSQYLVTVGIVGYRCGSTAKSTCTQLGPCYWHDCCCACHHASSCHHPNGALLWHLHRCGSTAKSTCTQLVRCCCHDRCHARRSPCFLVLSCCSSLMLHLSRAGASPQALVTFQARSTAEDRVWVQELA